jgi:hypothetical protein
LAYRFEFLQKIRAAGRIKGNEKSLEEEVVSGIKYTKAARIGQLFNF